MKIYRLDNIIDVLTDINEKAKKIIELKGILDYVYNGTNITQNKDGEFILEISLTVISSLIGFYHNSRIHIPLKNFLSETAEELSKQN